MLPEWHATGDAGTAGPCPQASKFPPFLQRLRVYEPEHPNYAAWVIEDARAPDLGGPLPRHKGIRSTARVARVESGSAAYAGPPCPEAERSLWIDKVTQGIRHPGDFQWKALQASAEDPRPSQHGGSSVRRVLRAN